MLVRTFIGILNIDKSLDLLFVFGGYTLASKAYKKRSRKDSKI